MKLLRQINPWDALWLLLLTGGSMVYLLAFFQLDGPPFEDAAMLMRYADHFADGHGIVWNIGEAPVDGATDFLFMVSVGALHKLGISLSLAVQILTIGAHLATVAVVFMAVRRIFDLPTIWALLPAAFVAVGPANVYIEAFFGTPYFALFGALMYYRMLRAFHGDLSARNGFWWALFGLLLGLTRPEGVFLVAMTWVVGIAWHGFGKMKPTTYWFLGWFGTVGLGYFIWHWTYFGHPLPNPFYVKGGGVLYLSSFKYSLINTFRMGLPVMLVLVAGLFQDRKKVIKGAFIIFPAFAFVAVWVFMSNAMNYFMRFQYVLVPILLMTWPGVVGEAVKRWEMKGIRVVAVVLLGVMLLLFQHWNYGWKTRMPADGRVALGEMLEPYAEKGYTMAVTEAGNLPYFSHWRTIDTWGLNDSHISHEGLTKDYLDRYRPELFMIHEFYVPGMERAYTDPHWTGMTLLLEEYLQENNYDMVACYGAYPASTHFYYLRRDFPDYAPIRQLIRTMDYRWYEDGETSTNFLEEPPELQNFGP